MTIHPTSGGVAPLYNPATPSFRSVCMRQSTGPLKCASFVVCNRTLIVSNLSTRLEAAFLAFVREQEASLGGRTYGWPTSNIQETLAIQFQSDKAIETIERNERALTTQLGNSRKHTRHEPFIISLGALRLWRSISTTTLMNQRLLRRARRRTDGRLGGTHGNRTADDISAIAPSLTLA